MNGEEKKVFKDIEENIILKLESKIDKAITGLATRLDKELANLTKELALHNQECALRSRFLDSLKCEEHTLAIQRHKEESKLKDLEHDEKFKAISGKIADTKKLFWVILAGILSLVIKSAF